MMDDSKLRLRLASDDPFDVAEAVIELWPLIAGGVNRMAKALLRGLTDQQQQRHVQRLVALELHANGRALSRSANIAEEALNIAFLEIELQRRALRARASSSNRVVAP
jgi:hypothetical protein